MIQFLYAPIVDVGPKRRSWLIIVAALAAACFAIAFAMPLPERKTPYLIFAFFGQMLSGLTGSCNGGLLALTMPDEHRGSASAWLNIGNLGGAGAAAWATLEMLRRGVSTQTVGLVFAAMLILPALPILLVDEPARERRTLRDVFADMWHSVDAALFNKAGLTGIALCLSPVGTAALTNFFSGMRHSFGASEQLVEYATGPLGVITTAVGAGICGKLCDLYNRRAMYLGSGVLTAICGVAIAIAPRTPDAYLWGVIAYNVTTGFCYAAFTAVVLETIGTGGKAASMQYALFVAAGNIAITYTGFLDTRFGGSEKLADGKSHPLVGNVITCDAVLNLVGVFVLGFAFYRLGSFGKSRERKVT
jgi:MFS family permease